MIANVHSTQSVKDRLELERTIIGAVLIENCYGRAGRFLVPNNFKFSHHQAIWQAISNMWPVTPIDLRTVNHQLVKCNRLHLSDFLVGCTEKINSTTNLEYHCLLLLETDILDKVLIAIEQAKTEAFDYQMRDAAHQIWIEMNSSTDVLVTLEEAARYLVDIDPDHQLTKQIVSYNSAVSARAAIIKANYPAKQLLINLERLGMSGDRLCQMAVRQISDLLIAILNLPTVPPHVVEQLFIINKSLSQ